MNSTIYPLAGSHLDLWKKRLVAAVAGVTIVTAVCSASGQTFDFNGGTLSGLTAYDPLSPFGCGAVYSYPSGGLRIQAPSSISPSTLGPARGGAYFAGQTYDNFTVSVDLIGWDDSVSQFLGPIARAGDIGIGTSDGYQFAWMKGNGTTVPSQVVLTRFLNESATALNGTPLSLDTSKDYRLVFSGLGTTLTGSIYDLSDLTTPLATISAQDGTFTSGFCGILDCGSTLNLATTLDATFDNLSIVPEPSVVSLALLGLAMAWRRSRWHRC